jgi:hypothetical protein
MIVGIVDVGVIVDHHCQNVIFITLSIPLLPPYDGTYMKSSKRTFSGAPIEQ